MVNGKMMNAMLRLVVAVTVGMGLFFISLLQANPDEGTIVPIGNVAVVTDAGESDESQVSFSWKNAEGNTGSLTDLRGKVVLINFWATWCIPCRKEIPELIEINNEMDPDGFELLGISVDAASDIQRVDMFINDQNINYINILDDGRLTRQFGNIRAIPTTLIIDKEGTVRETIVGIRSKDQFIELINKYL
jgi:thiol-disulfide isomerase/thioredoxin